MSVDPDLVAAWVKGWALARGTPAPVAEADGWRVDVGWPDQQARYVFAGLSERLAGLAAEIDRPFVLLKACAAPEAVAAVLPPGWSVRPPGFFMSCDGPQTGAGVAPDGYALEQAQEGPVAVVRLRAPDGTEAAIGRMVVADGRAIYDRIVTQQAHRRRGCGRAVMAALRAEADARGAAQGVLVATAEGRWLYEALGWRLHTPYSTAEVVAA
ncbi:GNAT family N-acetyltransferase [Caulobacter sp. 17J80-11]|uniref:GNAT family N-acetyltransferase n=1 Tax=Caulobacter sp. 17J80-11 TaxID=2763502 RepID=UPI001653E2F3|nr:GNAT family N-acetyltransferase [Caulobacter sp. 17J80-11]MBC6981287.1 GNAT family N-acetyltransferase [Caulobacter sp. 17J80-11]